MRTVKAEGCNYIASSLKDIQSIDQWLVQRYGIDCYNQYTVEREARGLGSAETEVTEVNHLEASIAAQTKMNGSPDPGLALRLTDLLAGDPWRSWWHSRRRAWGLDALSIASEIASQIRSKRGTATMLDVGCNIGFMATYIAEKHGLQTTGIDLSDAVLKQARRLDISSKVNFKRVDIESLSSGEQWDFVLSVDLVQPTENHFVETMTKVCSLVKEKGDLLVIANLVEYGNVVEFFQNNGFSCMSAQLTGGFQQGHAIDDFIDWSTKGAFHFKKQKGIDTFLGELSSDMSDFADYANSGGYSERELSRGYFLAHLVEDSA